jgi:hypothetical protein
MIDKIIFDEDPAPADLGAGDCSRFSSLAKFFGIEAE